jgi:hypothetical protein
MTDISRKYIFFPQNISSHEEEERKECSDSQQNDASEILFEKKLKAIGEEITSFIEKLQQQRKKINEQPSLCEIMLDQCTELKFKLNSLLLNDQLDYYQSANALVLQQQKDVKMLSVSLLKAENILMHAEGEIIQPGNMRLLTAAVKNFPLQQKDIATVQLTQEKEQPNNELYDSNTTDQTENNVMSRATPTKQNDVETYNTESSADDITTIGQDKMTPEEQFWHELSVMMAEIAALENVKKELEEISKLDSTTSLQDLLDRLNMLCKKVENYIKDTNFTVDGVILRIPDGLSKEQMEKLLSNSGISYEILENGQVAIKNFSLLNIQTTLARLKRAIDGPFVTDMLKQAKEALTWINYFMKNGDYKKYIDFLNNKYPLADKPVKDDSTLSGWLQSMLPGFDTIDKGNVTFYKSVIALITAWQSKINEFNKKYAEVLKSSDGINQSDSKHQFEVTKVKEMLAVMDDISAMKNQMAMILGGISETDLANLLEGTGISYTEMVGTVTLINLGDDIVKMLKDAVSSCFNKFDNIGNKYVVTPEQLTQFNNVLSQAQTQFDTVVKKVNTKTDSAKTLFNDTKEALSNLIKTAESLLADLAKMIR